MSQRIHIPTSTFLVIPSDGKGGVCSYRCASNAANTTVTSTTIVDANGTPFNQAHGGNVIGGGGALATTVPGDLIVTSDGFWATVASTTPGSTVTIAPVCGLPCGWRHMTDFRKDGQIPASATSVAIYSSSLLQGARQPRGTYISKLLVDLFVASDYNITIGDGYGTAIMPAIPIRGATSPLHLMPVDIALDLPHRGPFSVRFGGAASGKVFFDGQA